MACVESSGWPVRVTYSGVPLRNQVIIPFHPAFLFPIHFLKD
jgi:hypothetical protein